MNWTCPHCQRRLATSQPPPSGNAPEGWFYTLCGECQGPSIVCADTGEALRIAKVQPRIEALPVTGPVELPPPPIVAQNRTQSRSSVRMAALYFPLILFVVGTGAYLLEERRESLARAVIARDIAAQVIARETTVPGTPKSVISEHSTSDQLKTSAASVASASASSPHESFEVQARDRTASLHSGPGSEYAILGAANPEDRYAVLEMTPHWFKIPLGEAGQVAWIQRRDVDVRIQKEPSDDEESDHDRD